MPTLIATEYRLTVICKVDIEQHRITLITGLHLAITTKENVSRTNT